MPSPAYASKEDEYWYNVSPQDDLPLAGQIDLEIDLKSISVFFLKLAGAANVTSAKKIIRECLIDNPVIFSHARQFLGLSDKRAYLDLSYIASRTPHPTQATSISGCHPWTLSRHPMAFFLRLLSGSQGKPVQISTADMIAAYMIEQGLYEAARGFSGMSENLMQLVYTRLISPKEYQQKAAKRRGHGCEAALAEVLEQCGIDMIPKNKAANPMGANDPHLNLETMTVSERQAGTTHAFDMIILSDKRVIVAIQSLIHTSDPGQYGVDKSNETVSIAGKIKKWNTQNKEKTNVELWGLVDGVGFSENKSDTINKLLKQFNNFVQIKTLYKAPLRLHLLGQIKIKGIFFSDYYDTEDIDAIKNIYVPKDVKVITAKDETLSSWKSIRCGEAVIYI
ncbi:hypothetical protein [Desulfuromonas sp. CSMB_57]|uniref:hypothetical protein n=1 Tax=Desulfuromonas sp. CSMB_57 TaxID=2807629 RepID=UPI001CD50C4B|nr:hypothetical protein [Desulfuromonas sp. CSMB_57]